MGASRRADPCKLTPYEQRIWELYQRGLNSTQIAAELKLAGRYSVEAALVKAKEKIEAQKYDEMI